MTELTQSKYDRLMAEAKELGVNAVVKLYYRPDTLNIMGIPFKAIYCKDIADVAPDKRSIIFGYSSLENATIRVFDGNGIEFTYQTLLHEVLHMIGDLTKLNMLETSNEQNHKELECLSNVLADFLFRNNLIKVGEK
jgi:hypothetical protein